MPQRELLGDTHFGIRPTETRGEYFARIAEEDVVIRLCSANNERANYLISFHDSGNGFVVVWHSYTFGDVVLPSLILIPRNATMSEEFLRRIIEHRVQTWLWERFAGLTIDIACWHADIAVSRAIGHERGWYVSAQYSEHHVYGSNRHIGTRVWGPFGDLSMIYPTSWERDGFVTVSILYPACGQRETRWDECLSLFADNTVFPIPPYMVLP